MVHIAIFASGSGTNAENIITYFKDNRLASVDLVLTNNSGAGVIARAQKDDVPVVVFNRDELNNGTVLKTLLNAEIDFVVLAGFLLLMPPDITEKFHNKMINIHPALLPKYGGKGMYGSKVHQAVIHNKEQETGITIHYVNPEYDKGDIIFQARCEVSPSDSPETVAAKVHELEYKHFPAVIERLVDGLSG